MTTDIDLLPGDVFCSTNPMALGRAINAIQLFWSKDNESKYSHAGIILDEDGTTFEALWSVKSQNLWAKYEGGEVLIARPSVPMGLKKHALKKLVSEHEGQWYPFWRLGMHLIPPLAKVALFERLVCSELTAKYLTYLGIRKTYKGVNPDTLADEWEHWKSYDIIFEGRL